MVLFYILQRKCQKEINKIHFTNSNKTPATAKRAQKVVKLALTITLQQFPRISSTKLKMFPK